MNQNSLEIATPDDWHLHLRDGDALRYTVPATSRCFARAIVMPNLSPPVETVAQAETYRDRILEHVPQGDHFEPLMTLYLTDRTRPSDVKSAAESAFVHAYKLYPAGATTNSATGVNDLSALYPVLEQMEKHDVPLLVHGEVTDAEIDIFDRERVFIDRHLIPIQQRFPALRIVLEHITSADAVEFVLGTPATVAATMTPQHLLFNRNDMLVGGIRPHLYCLPILKARLDQNALQRAAVSGNPKFFLGTDSAPHARPTKESACGCAGCYSAPVAIELYATIFDRLNALDRLEAFACHFGADFYRLPRNTGRVRLERGENIIPERLPYTNNGEIVPLAAGTRLNWRLAK
jgi:dihydroorotase